MSLYRVTPDKLESVSRTTFAAENLLERKDLQRLLRKDITPIGDDLMVIDEEYGDWEDSNRRIDLLCLNKGGGLVVVEIKRTEDGGHMELQAIRYAAMVSSMTLEQVIKAYASACGGDEDTARAGVLNFLQLDSEDEAELTGEVRIVLVSADFSTELTTAVLWLNRHDIDITCIRLRPYRMGNEILIDATQIIPLPEATDYEVKVRAQEKEKRKVVGARQEIFRKFWAQLIDRSKARTQLLANRTTTVDHWLSAGIGRSGFSLNNHWFKMKVRLTAISVFPVVRKKVPLHFMRFLQRRARLKPNLAINWIGKNCPVVRDVVFVKTCPMDGNLQNQNGPKCRNVLLMR